MKRVHPCVRHERRRRSTLVESPVTAFDWIAAGLILLLAGRVICCVP